MKTGAESLVCLWEPPGGGVVLGGGEGRAGGRMTRESVQMTTCQKFIGRYMNERTSRC
jgi:hypothetical protein